jgi:apolipoprotein N-acyltransferase
MVFRLGMLMAVPNMCLLAWGWRRRALVFAAGALSALALPPYGYLPVLFVTLSCFVWLLDGAIEIGERSLRQRFATGLSIGWWFGFGYFLAGLWWIGGAFLVEADRFAWMIPFAILAMPAGLALFIAVGIGCAALFWSDRSARIVMLAVFLSLSDWLRGHVLTGFPWNSFGYAFGDALVLAQSASVVGLYGLTFLAVLICSAPALLVDNRTLGEKVGRIAVVVLVLAAMTGFGLYRLHIAADPGATETDLRIVQPAIAQSEKWRPENRDSIFDSYLDFTQRPLGGDARVGHDRLVIWPESAVPFLLTHEPGALFRISQALGPASELITGAIRFEQTGDGPAYFNSVYLIGPDGGVRDVYDKVRLVPFGEYLPLRGVLQRLGLEKLVDAPGAFHSGYRHRALTSQAGPSLLPLVCYEAIFPGISASSNGRPSFLLNVTNDAWFGNTPGPYQHFGQARMRAIEQGLPLVRAANTGISAVVDAKGRVLVSLSLNERGVLDTQLPERLEPTVYGRYGDSTFAILVVFGLICAGFGRYNRDSRKD